MTFNQKPRLGKSINIKHPSAKGLISSWLMNESSGDIVFDSSHEKYHGTNLGAVWVPQGLDFDGADRIQLAEPIINNHDAFTITARFNGAAGGIVYAEGYSGDTNWALFMGIDPNPPYSGRFFYKENNVWKGITVGTTAVNDGWHTVSLSQLNKSYRTIYIDGIPEAVNTDTVGDMSTLNVANIGVLERSTFGSYFIGDMEYVHLHDRGLIDSEVKLHTRDPYGMFRPAILPQNLYRYLNDTGILSGKIIIRDVSVVLVDGLLQLKDKATDIADGRAQIKDVNEDAIDGKIQLKDTDTDLVDGKVQLKDANTELIDGLAKVQDVAIGQADGKISIRDRITNVVDGKIRVKDAVTVLIDGAIKIKDTATKVVDGKLKISLIGTNLIDCLIKIKDVATDIIDGKISVISTTDRFDGLLQIPTRYRISTSSEQQHTISVINDEDYYTITTTSEQQHNIVIVEDEE